MAVRVSDSSLCLFHLCAPGLLCGIWHKADGLKPFEHSFTQGCPSVENFFNGHKVAFFPFILFLTFMIFPLLTGHTFVFFLTADEVQLSHGCDHKPGAVGVRI